MSRRIALIGCSLLALGIVLGAFGVILWQHWYPPCADPDPLPSASLEGTIYLPLNDNQGSAFTDDDLQAAIQPLVRHFGGATLGPKRRGFWLADGRRVQSEPIQLLTVSFPRDRLGAFRRAVAEVGRRLGQHSMYVRFEEPRVELIAVPRTGAKKDR